MAVVESDTEADPDKSRKSRVPPWMRWGETLGITLVFLALGAWNRPEDPFYLSGSFPWPVLAPVLMGLRYGFFMALVSSLVVMASLGIYLQSRVPEQSFPYVWTVGLLGLSLLSGEFRDYWERQRQKLEGANAYRSARLEEFTRSYYLLKVSHDRLEQQLAGSSSSLREALRRLYDEVHGPDNPGLDRDNAQRMLQLLVRYGSLQVAALYPVIEGRLGSEPLATVGRYQPISPQDPLLVHALEERKLVSVQSEYRQRLYNLDTDLLAALPMIDCEDRFVGICVVQAMPFFNFEPKTLRLLAILAGHMADILTEKDQAGEEASQEWNQFHRHLRRVAQDAVQRDLPAALVGLVLPEEGGNPRQMVEQIRRTRRGLDLVVERQVQGRWVVLVLMPLTDELGLAGYLHRLEQGLRESQGADSPWRPHPQSLQIENHTQAMAWLSSFLEVPASPALEREEHQA